MSASENHEHRCVRDAGAILVGRKIARVRYMTRDEAKASMWGFRPLIIELDNGTLLFAACDEEGNDAGVLFVETASRDLVLGRLP